MNVTYINNLTAQVNAIGKDGQNPCAAFAILKAQAEAAIENMLAEANAQIAALKALAELNPSDLPRVISSVKQMLSPYILAYEQAIQDLTQLTTALTQLTTAIANKASTLGCS